MKEFAPGSPASRPRRSGAFFFFALACAGCVCSGRTYQVTRLSETFIGIQFSQTENAPINHREREKKRLHTSHDNSSQILKRKTPATSSSRGAPGKVVGMDQALRATQSQSELMITPTSTLSIARQNQGDSSVSLTLRMNRHTPRRGEVAFYEFYQSDK